MHGDQAKRAVPCFYWTVEVQSNPKKMPVMCAQLHGTCLGFEALAVIVSGDGKVLTKFDSYDNASPLVLTEDGRAGSAFFEAFPADVLRGLQEQPLAMENHGKGGFSPFLISPLLPFLSLIEYIYIYVSSAYIHCFTQ